MNKTPAYILQVFFDFVRREIVILRTAHGEGVHEYHLNDNIIGNNH